jgi:hypothetical protein
MYTPVKFFLAIQQSIENGADFSTVYKLKCKAELVNRFEA